MLIIAMLLVNFGAIALGNCVGQNKPYIVLLGGLLILFGGLLGGYYMAKQEQEREEAE